MLTVDYKYILTQSWADPSQNFNPEHWPVGCIGNLNTTHTQTHFEVSFDPALLPSCLLITLSVFRRRFSSRLLRSGRVIKGERATHFGPNFRHLRRTHSMLTAASACARVNRMSEGPQSEELERLTFPPPNARLACHLLGTPHFTLSP